MKRKPDILHLFVIIAISLYNFSSVLYSDTWFTVTICLCPFFSIWYLEPNRGTNLSCPKDPLSLVIKKKKFANCLVFNSPLFSLTLVRRPFFLLWWLFRPPLPFWPDITPSCSPSADLFNSGHAVASRASTCPSSPCQTVFLCVLLPAHEQPVLAMLPVPRLPLHCNLISDFWDDSDKFRWCLRYNLIFLFQPLYSQVRKQSI